MDEKLTADGIAIIHGTEYGDEYIWLPRAQAAVDAARKDRDEARAKLEQVDDVLICNWIEVENGDYRKALNDLIAWNIQIHDDPAVSEVAAKRKVELDEARAEAKRLREALAAIRTQFGRKQMITPYTHEKTTVCALIDAALADEMERKGAKEGADGSSS